MHEREQGLTLVELLIVAAIVGLLAALAIPQVRSSRIAANEAAVLKDLRAVQSSYAGRSVDCTRPRDSYVGTKAGYVRGCTDGAYWARPEVQGQTGVRGFAADGDGRICFTTDGVPPDPKKSCEAIR